MSKVLTLEEKRAARDLTNVSVVVVLPEEFIRAEGTLECRRCESCRRNYTISGNNCSNRGREILVYWYSNR